MLAALRHPNLVQVFALGAEQDDVYFVMELVEGEPLSDVITRNAAGHTPIELEFIGRIVEEVGDALESIHALGIVHRDVKPANVLLDPSADRSVLVDVGVARRREEEIDAAGTPGYAAPECFLDQAETPASDVYGLAATAYAMLTGRAPYEGGELLDLIARQMNQEPPRPSRLRPGLPPAVDAVLAKALAARPADRFASAPAFAVALSRALARAPVARPAPAPAAPPGPPLLTVRPSAFEPDPQAPGTARGPRRPTCRGAFLRVAGRLLEREPGMATVLRQPIAAAQLAAALAVSPTAWQPIDELVALLRLPTIVEGDPAGLAARVGRATVSATLARFFGADPATLGPAALLKAAEIYWARYHAWGTLAVVDVRGGVRATVATSPGTLICDLVGGSLTRIAELAGASDVTLVHHHGDAACAFDVGWAR
jgi:hypothetical protein